MEFLEGFLLNRLDLKGWKAPGAFSQYTLRRSPGVFVAKMVFKGVGIG